MSNERNTRKNNNVHNHVSLIEESFEPSEHQERNQDSIVKNPSHVERLRESHKEIYENV